MKLDLVNISQKIILLKIQASYRFIDDAQIRHPLYENQAFEGDESIFI